MSKRVTHLAPTPCSMGWVMPSSHLDFLHLFTCISRNTITPASNLNMSADIRWNSQHTRAYPKRKKSSTQHPALYMYAGKLERNFGIVRHLMLRRILHKWHGSNMNSRWRNGRKIDNPWRLQKAFISELYVCLEQKFNSLMIQTTPVLCSVSHPYRWKYH